MAKKKRWIAEATIITHDQIDSIEASTKKEAIKKARIRFKEENPADIIMNVQVWGWKND